MPTLVVHTAAAGSPLATGITVTVNGRSVPVHRSGTLDFASVCSDGPCAVEISCDLAEPLIAVRPLHRGVAATTQGGVIRFSIDRPRTVYVEFKGRPSLALRVTPLETWVPEGSSDAVIHFGPGMHDAGEITIGSHQTLYLAGGAWVRGYVRCAGAERPAIRGRGVLDGSQIPRNSRHMIIFDGCRDVLVEGITSVDTPCWNLVFGGCSGVVASHLALIGWVVSSDGIDVVGSRDVLIEDCFLRNNDDCVVLKAMAYEQRDQGHPRSWQRDVENVRVRRCVCYNDQAGNALEIGFETRTTRIRDVIFEDLDIIGAHGEGGVFTIHNGDRAIIEDVLYRDIRVEHFYDRLVDFRVLRSRYSKDPQRGIIRKIHLQTIRCIVDAFNTPSLIGGFDADHPVEDILFEDFRMGDVPVSGPDGLHLFTSHVRGIVFR
jgi:hypothetical protein